MASTNDKMALSVSLDPTEFNKGVDEMDKKLMTLKETLDSFGGKNAKNFNSITDGLENVVPKLSEVITDLKTTNTEVKTMATNFGMSITQIQTLATKILDMKNVAKGTGSEVEKDLTVSAAKILPESTINEIKNKIAQLKKASENVNLVNDLGSNKNAVQEIDRLKNKLNELNQTEDQLAKKRDAASLKQQQNLKKEIDGINKMIAAAQKSIGQTYGGAIKTAESASTINQRTEAIKNLTAARGNLSKADENYTAKLQNLNNQIARLDRENKQAAGSTDKLNERKRNLMDTASQLQRRLALVFSVSAITGYVEQLVAARGEMELQLRSLEAIIQSKQKANELFSQVTDLAVKSPFQLTELISYTKQLAAYRVETGKLFETTKMLADVSAGLGVDMQRLILAYGQVKAANYLRGQELRQFSESGINILGELAKQFELVEGRTISVGEVFERVSKRMVSFSDVEEVFKRLTSQGGIFYNMQELQSETLKGQVSNLRDSIAIMMNEIGIANDGVLKGFVALIRSAVDNWRIFAEALKLVILGYGALKINQLIVTRGLLSQYNALKLIALEENKRLIKEKQRELLTSGTTSARVTQLNAEIIALKRLSTEQYVNMLSTTNMTKAQLQLLISRNLGNKSLIRAILSLKLLTSEEVRAAFTTNVLGQKLNILKFAFLSISGAAKIASASIGAFLTAAAPLLIFTALIYGVTKLVTAFTNQKQALEDNQKAFDDTRTNIDAIGVAYEKATKKVNDFNSSQQEKNDAIGKQREALQKLKDQLEEIGVDWEVNITTLKPEMFDEQFRLMNKELASSTALIESLNKSFIEMDSWTTGGEFFGNKIGKDLKQLGDAIKSAGDLGGRFDTVYSNLIKNKKALSDVSKQLLESFGEEQRKNETLDQYNARRIESYKKLIRSIEPEKFRLFDEKTMTQITDLSTALFRIKSQQLEAVKEVNDAVDNFFKDNPQLDINTMLPEDKRKLLIYFDQVLIKQQVQGLAAELLRQEFRAKIKLVAELPKETDLLSKYLGQGWTDRLSKWQTVKGFQLIPDEELKNGSFTISKLQDALRSNLAALKKEYKDLAKSQSQESINRRNDILKEIELNNELTKLYDLDNTEKSKGVADPILERTKKQIQAIKDAQKAYEEYLKYFSKEDAFKKTIADYGVILKGLNVPLDSIFDFSDQSTVKILEAISKGVKGKSIDELRKEIASKNAEIGVELTVVDFEQFQKDVQNKIDNYELTMEITKLGFDPKAVTDLFGDAAVTLDDLKEYFKNNAADIGVTKSYKELLKLTPEEQLALVKDGNQKRLEEMIKLAKKIDDVETKSKEQRINEYAKIIKEYQSFENQISAIRKKANEDRANAEKDLAKRPEDLEVTIAAIDKKEANDISQILFDSIKNTDLWISTFENLEKVGDTALQVLYDQLKQFSQGAGKNLDIPAFKELIKQLEKLEDQMKKRNPFKTIKDSIVAYSIANEGLEEKIALAEQAQTSYRLTLLQFGDESPEATEALKKLDAALKDVTDSENTAQKNAYYLTTAIQQVSASVKGIGTATKTTAQGVYDLAKAMGYLSDETDTAYQSTLDLVDGQFQALDGVAQIIGGAYKKDTGMIIAGIGAAAQGTWNSILAAIDLWGKDSKFQKVIVEVTDDLNKLKDAMNRLDDITFSSTNMTDFSRNFEKLQDNIREQYAAIEKMRDAEQSKKNADKDAIAQYEQDLQDLVDKEKDILEQRYAEAGIFELKSAIQDIASAWYEAYYAGEDTLTAITKKVKEFVRTYIQQMMLMQGADVILANVRNAMISFLEDDNFLDAEEMAELNRLVGVASEDLNNFFEGLSNGIGMFANNTNMSELQRGLTAMTESTAEALEALLNSIRLRMFQHYDYAETKANEIVLKLEQQNNLSSQILAETSVIRQTLQQMRLWQDSITNPSHVSGGASLKVKAEIVS